MIMHSKGGKNSHSDILVGKIALWELNESTSFDRNDFMLDNGVSIPYKL